MPAKKKVTRKRVIKKEVIDTDMVEGALAPQLPEPKEVEEVVVPAEESMSMSEPISEVKSQKRSVRNVGFILLLLVVLAIILSVPAVYFYNQYKAMQAKVNPTAATQAQITTLIAHVGNLMLLPTDEMPTVATVSDKSKLSGQSFFSHAENGDQVLIYPKARKAILYRPSTNKIIEVGPVNLQIAQQTPTTAVAGASTQAASLGQASSSADLSPTPVQVKVALYNGTTTSGLTKTAEPVVNAVDQSVKVTTKINAAKDSYETTQVILLNPADSALASKIAAKVKGSVVSTLPEGETKPVADILVILGQDFVK
jgi:hypothetical protein